MTYNNELQSKLKHNINALTNTYKVSIGKDYAVIEGHKGIITFKPDHIVLRLKVGMVDIVGENMIIVQSQREEIVIKGKISQVSFEGVNK